jgi:hypothetical protein
MIEIENPDGSVSNYKKLSERLPAFLEAFPFSEGYRIIITTKSLGDVTGTDTAKGVIFTATLYKEEMELVNASSCRLPPSQQKDWEKGETAARQRLLAACGFGGDILDEDEEGDISDLGGLVRSSPASKQEAPAKAPAAPKATAQPSQPEPVTPAEEEPLVEPETSQQEEPQQQLAMVTEQQPQSSQAEETPSGEAPPAAMVRQIQHLSKVRQLPFVEPRTKDEARTMLKELMKQSANAA